MFECAGFTTRNIGFVPQGEQTRLRGACILGRVRAGGVRSIIPDLDAFEVSNLNLQAFAVDHTIDRHKAEATADTFINHAVIVVNGPDDVGAFLLLHRRTQAIGTSVMGTYGAPLPSVYVTSPRHIAQKERLVHPTIGTAWDAITDDQRETAFPKEFEWGVIHSSFRTYIDLVIVAVLRPLVRHFLTGLMK